MKSNVNSSLMLVNVRQFIRFVLVGLLNTVIFYGIYVLLLQVGYSYAFSLLIGTIIGIVNSYVWNKFFTFRKKLKSIWETVKFFIVYGVQYLSNLLIIHTCVTVLGISAELAGLVAICFGVFISFFGHKYWTFRSA